MALLFCSSEDDWEGWRRALLAELPGLDLRRWPDTGRVDEIEAALVWRPPPGMLAGLPRLRAIFSLAAGVDALLADPTLPNLPLCRMVDPSLTSTMSAYVLAQILRYHRGFDVYEEQQRRRAWELHLPRPPASCRVGIMGLGVLGRDAARLAAGLGYAVRGWSRSAKTVAGIACHAGEQGLAPFLDGLDILVCLLPLTAETEGILGAALFARLPMGARLVNVARGGHLDQAALLDALACGRIGHATLDVFGEEPLPEDHPFWAHPKVTVTPHAASYSLPETGAACVAENLRRLGLGLPLLHLVDPARGY